MATATAPQTKTAEEPTTKVWTLEEAKAARAAFKRNADAAWARGRHQTTMQ